MPTVARGKTFSCRDVLKSFGFRWDNDRQLWIRIPSYSNEELEDVRRAIRRCGNDGHDASKV